MPRPPEVPLPGASPGPPPPRPSACATPGNGLCCGRFGALDSGQNCLSARRGGARLKAAALPGLAGSCGGGWGARGVGDTHQAPSHAKSALSLWRLHSFKDFKVRHVRHIGTKRFQLKLGFRVILESLEVILLCQLFSGSSGCFSDQAEGLPGGLHWAWFKGRWPGPCGNLAPRHLCWVWRFSSCQLGPVGKCQE